MRITQKKIDLMFLFLLALILVGLPLGIRVYDRWIWQKRILLPAKEFTLTGHTERGWLTNVVYANDVISLWVRKNDPMKKPVIKVSKGDRVFLKLKSSDVVHGFSLKDFGIFITEGIEPGKVTLVSFEADKVGTFTFSCNAICGENHKDMKGIIVVTV